MQFKGWEDEVTLNKSIVKATSSLGAFLYNFKLEAFTKFNNASFLRTKRPAQGGDHLRRKSSILILSVAHGSVIEPTFCFGAPFLTLPLKRFLVV